MPDNPGSSAQSADELARVLLMPLKPAPKVGRMERRRRRYKARTTIRERLMAALPRVLYRTDLSDGAKLTYMILWQIAYAEGDDYTATPQAQLMGYLGCRPRVVKYRIQELLRSGAIGICTEHNVSLGRGRGFAVRRNVYTFP